MMTTTEHRPVPLPPRPMPTARLSLPAGAARWAKTWLDETGVPHRSNFEVPVDADDRRTAHLRCVCRGEIEVAGKVMPCDHVRWVLPGEAPGYCPDHGAALQPEKAEKRPGLPWAKVWDVVDERIRVAVVVGGIGAAGVVADVANGPWWGDAAEFAALPAVVASSWWLTRWWLTRQAVKRGDLDPSDEIAGRRRRKRIAKQARIAGYTATAAAAWVETADVAGIDPTTLRGLSVWAVLVALGVIGSRPYLAYVDARRNIQPAVLEPEPEPEAEDAPVRDPGVEYAERWVMHAPNGAVANTRLIPETWRKVVGGWGIMIRATVPGAIDVDMLTDASAKGKLRTIAGTFGIPKKAFNFVEDDDPNQVLMLVQPNPPLAEAKLWLGPGSIDVERGVAHTGYFIDGGDVWEPFYRYGWGAPSKVVTGTTGSGKSENLRKQMVIERYFAHTDPDTGVKRGLFATFLHDFKQFESYGEFRPAVHAAGSTVEDAYIMRDALIREMHRRYAMLASYVWYDKKDRRREGGIKWDPRIHGPILSWVIDEFHEIAKDQEFIGPLERLARKMRACGIRITIGTHLATLGDTGSRGFRDMLAGGYALLGRTTDGLTSVITGGQLTADPRQLPKLPGMCLVADGEQQTMHARQTFVPADEDEPLNVYDLLFDDNNNPIGYPAELPPETLEAFGPDWAKWAEAGKQPGGRSEGVWLKEPAVAQSSAADGVEFKSAKEAVLSVLFTAMKPLDIDGVDAALRPLRERGLKCSTRTARVVLAELFNDKIVCKPKHGFYDLEAHVREDLLAQAAEKMDQE